MPILSRLARIGRELPTEGSLKVGDDEWTDYHAKAGELREIARLYDLAQQRGEEDPPEEGDNLGHYRAKPPLDADPDRE